MVNFLSLASTSTVEIGKEDTLNISGNYYKHDLDTNLATSCLIYYINYVKIDFIAMLNGSGYQDYFCGSVQVEPQPESATSQF